MSYANKSIFTNRDEVAEAIAKQERWRCIDPYKLYEVGHHGPVSVWDGSIDRLMQCTQLGIFVWDLNSKEKPKDHLVDAERVLSARGVPIQYLDVRPPPPPTEQYLIARKYIVELQEEYARLGHMVPDYSQLIDKVRIGECIVDHGKAQEVKQAAAALTELRVIARRDLERARFQKETYERIKNSQAVLGHVFQPDQQVSPKEALTARDQQHIYATSIDPITGVTKYITRLKM